MINSDTPSFWGIKKQSQFTEMELALMAGGQSLPEMPKEINYSFIKALNKQENEKTSNLWR
jgi:hypothetical protein